MGRARGSLFGVELVCHPDNKHAPPPVVVAVDARARRCRQGRRPGGDWADPASSRVLWNSVSQRSKWAAVKGARPPNASPASSTTTAAARQRRDHRATRHRRHQRPSIQPEPDAPPERRSRHPTMATDPRRRRALHPRHGATVGRLDDDALLYLRSRGTPLDAARTMPSARSFATSPMPSRTNRYASTSRRSSPPATRQRQSTLSCDEPVVSNRESLVRSHGADTGQRHGPRDRGRRGMPWRMHLHRSRVNLLRSRGALNARRDSAADIALDADPLG